ncbi:reverse transcriptase domain-containing protein [Tanacetum coccineum]
MVMETTMEIEATTLEVGTQGAVGLAHWFKKMESLFHISNCTIECQKTLMKMMTENYYPRSEIKKLETELWNLVVKGTDVESYTQRFQELILLCLRMLPEESDRLEKYTGGLPDSIQGSVMASKLTKLQEDIKLSRSLMDQKLLTYAARQAENKRRLDNNSRNNNA